MSPYDIGALVVALGLAVTLWLIVNRRHRELREHRKELDLYRQSIDEQARVSNVYRRQLLDALTDPFLLIEKEGLIRFANKAAREMFSANSLTGRTVRESFTDPRLAQALTQGLLAGKPDKTRLTLPQQASLLREQENRGVNSWLVDVAPLPDSEESPPMCRVIIRDITLEQQAEQVRQDFVANASHELRTPMAIIHGYLENLLDDEMLEDTEITRKFLSVMRKHSDRMSRIIEDMLVISRLESGEESSLNIEPFNLKECLQDITERLESLIRNREAKIKIKLPDDDIKIEGDRFYWTQALFNLVENALKQNSRPGLKIEIGCEIHDNQLQVWVSDDGTGIPSADLPFVFRRFYRVDKHHTESDIKGTGLGLSIVKRAIEAHDGTIQATSTPGIETKFLMTMPLQGPLKQPRQLELSPDPLEG